MGSRVRGANGESFREARSHVRTGRVVRGNSGSCERIRRRNKASKRVNPNRAAIKAAGVQGDRETSGTRQWLRLRAGERRGKGVHSRWRDGGKGHVASAARQASSETAGDKAAVFSSGGRGG
jgi:hypothetical protein